MADRLSQWPGTVHGDHAASSQTMRLRKTSHINAMWPTLQPVPNLHLRLQMQLQEGTRLDMQPRPFRSAIHPGYRRAEADKGRLSVGPSASQVSRED